MEDGGWLAAVIAGAALLVSVGQFRLARSARKLQDASSQVAQYSAWLQLGANWRWAVLAARGPSQSPFSGFNAVELAEFRQVIEEFRQSAVHYYDSYPRDDDDMEVFHHAGLRHQAAEAALSCYRSRVEEVLGFLGRAAGLVFRGNISIVAVYNAFGADLVANRDVVQTLTSEIGTTSDHPGAYMPIFDSFRDAELDEVCRKAGWATAFGELPGLLQRIRALTVLMVAHATIVGDLAVDGPASEATVSESQMRAALTCTRRSSLPRSVRVAWNLYRARSTNKSQGFITAESIDAPFTGYWKARLYMVGSAMLFPISLVRLIAQRGHIREGLWVD